MNEFKETDGQLSKLYEIFFKFHPSPIYVWKYYKNDFILIKYNNIADTLTKGKMKDFLGIKASELYKDRLDILEDLYRSNRNKTSFSKELKYFYQTLNEEKILNVNYYFIQPELILVHIEDITDRKKAEEKLIKSEENYRNLVNNINDILIEVDENRNISYISPQAYDILGYLPEQIIGTNTRDFIHFDEKLMEKEDLLNALRSGEPLYAEHRVKHKDGHYVLLSMKGKVVKIDEHVKIIGIFRDITKRKKAEEKLRENEQFLQNVFDAIRDGISVLDRELNIVRVNKWIEEMYKDSIPLIGKKCYEVYQKRMTVCPWCPSEKALKTEELQSEIVPYPSADKPTGWIELSAFPLKDENGNVVNVIEYVKNITIQKKAEQLLKESEEKYRNIIESMGDAIHVIDKDLRIIYTNLAFKKWLKNLDLDNILEGKTVFEAFPFLAEKVRDEYLQVFNNGNIIISEESTKLKGEEVLTETRKIPIIKEKKVEQIITIIRNITERRIAEQKLRDSEEKYRSAYSRSNLYKDLFTHDINNIFQNILSSTELFSLQLKNQDTPQKFDEILNLVKEQITRGSKLVKNVQKLSEIEDMKKSIISIDLCETLKTSLSFLRSNFRYKNIDIKIISSQGKVFVRGNDLLNNVFENVLLNAVRHNLNEKIEINIKISKINKNKTDFIKLEFIDNGIGIPDLLKKEIFTRKISEIEKEKISSGMGLGLILVKSILNAINAEITIENKISGDYTKGSNFTILIPEAK